MSRKRTLPFLETGRIIFGGSFWELPDSTASTPVILRFALVNHRTWRLDSRAISVLVLSTIAYGLQGGQHARAHQMEDISSCAAKIVGIGHGRGVALGRVHKVLPAFSSGMKTDPRHPPNSTR